MFTNNDDLIEYHRNIFRKRTQDHQMKVFHDQGVYRHLHFYKEGDGNNWSWDIITWPGSLGINGDIGESLIFSRENDMLLDFFHGNNMRISFDYWAEKCTRRFDELTRHSLEVFMETIEDHLADILSSNNVLSDDIQEMTSPAEILESARDVADSPSQAYEFAFDCGLDEPNFDLWKPSFIISCFAIAFAARKYTAHLLLDKYK